MNLPKKFFSFPPRPSRDRSARWRALVLSLLVMGLAALQATPARADVWGYVDAQGVTHFSATQLDERYGLFFRRRRSIHCR